MTIALISGTLIFLLFAGAWAHFLRTTARCLARGMAVED